MIPLVLKPLEASAIDNQYDNQIRGAQLKLIYQKKAKFFDLKRMCDENMFDYLHFSSLSELFCKLLFPI